MGVMQDRRRIIAAQPHRAGVTGRMVTIAPEALPLQSLTVSFSAATGLEVLLMTGNIFDTETGWSNGYYNDSGTLMSSTATGHSTTYLPVAPSTAYSMVGCLRSKTISSGGGLGVYFWTASGGWNGRKTYTVPPNSRYYRHDFTTPAATAQITCQGPVGDTADAYGFEPENIRICKTSDIQTLTVDWSNRGMLYDGTVDLVTGVLTGATTSGGTPSTYQLTAQRIIPVAGETHLWSDAGNISVTYWTH